MTHLAITSATGPSTDIGLCSTKGNGRESSLVVRANGRGNHKNCGTVRGPDSKGLLCPNGRWTQVQRVPSLIRDPAVLDFQELLDTREELSLVKLGERQPLTRAREPGHVHVRAKEPDLAFRVLVCLHAFEALDAVVEDNARGIQGQLAIRLDFRRFPACL